ILNYSSVMTFILVGFSEYPYLQVPLFLLLLTIYTVTLVGNVGIIMVIMIDPKLHTPMYFFLQQLSILDICYSSVFIPKLLQILIMKDRTISFNGCMTQFFFICTFVITEMFMLAVMAYDRFTAVCNPLLYTVAMSHKLCALLVYSAVISVSHSGSSVSQMECLVISLLSEACSVLITLASYVFIVVTIVKMSSKGGLQKAFSTCTSHLAAISIFHGIILLLYGVPNSNSSQLFVRVATALYSVMIPNLRNKDVKETVMKLINSKLHPHLI
uniref:G-protein coupled receptors family 1 profile domain-containing protein n=1 Tax=Jaculus jaculus TaxID=51337 RepID=A0A8C5L8L9_JACJA